MPSIIKQVIVSIIVFSMVFMPWQTGNLTAATPEPPDSPQRTLDVAVDGKMPLTYTTGFIAPEQDLAHLEGQYEAHVQCADALPSQFDWRNVGGNNFVSPIRNQGACGACYAFSAVGNFESKVMIDGAVPYPGPDYSENHAKECNWHEASGATPYGSCVGGNTQMMANLYSTRGTVLESNDPYTDTDAVCNSPMGPYETTVKDWHEISRRWIPSPAVLKDYLYQHGPLPVALYTGDNDPWETQFNSYSGGAPLYYSGPPTTTVNHGVLLVGWDDTTAHPGGNGVWIFKNSWGTFWGDNGFGYIAYGSANIGMYASYIDNWQHYDNHGGIFYYDEAGATGGAGYGTTTAWGMTVYTATAETSVTAVEFWSNDVTTDIDITLYEAFNDSTPQNVLWQSQNHAFAEAGYHSIPVDAELPLTAGDTVAAVVKFTTAVYTYPVPIDQTGPASGNSYLSSHGSSWSQKPYDIGIRLRTSNAPVNVGIAKQALVANFGPLEPITFTLTLSNIGSSPANNVVVTDIIPSEVVNITVDSTIVVTETGTEDYVWQVAPIGVGQTEVISIYGHLAGSVVPGASFVNEARISDPQDATPGNNVSQVVVGSQYVYLPFVARQYPPLQTRMFYATEDAGIMQGFPTTNTGADVDMKVGYELNGCFGSGNAQISRSLIKFNLTSLPVTAVTKATLHVRDYKTCGWLGVANAPLTAYRITGTWSENVVTWNNAPGFAESYGTVLIPDPLGDDYASEWREIDVTGLVNVWLGGTPNQGVMVRGYEVSNPNDPNTIAVWLLQKGTGYGPWLEVEYYGLIP